MLVNVSRLTLGRFLVGACLLTTAFPAHADEVTRCSNAADKGQELRDAHKLVEAREMFRECGRAQCPAVIQRECVKWLADVDQSLPTVVVSAKDARGMQLVDVTVTADGRPFAAQLDGQARVIDPGVHTFRFERGSAMAEKKVAVREGEKNQSIMAVLDTPGVAATAFGAPAAGPPASDANATREAAPAAAGMHLWTATGWVLGGAGVVGVGIGAVFGLIASSDKGRAHCDAGGYCDADALASARRHATASTIGFVAGGILIAGGMALVVFGPSGDAPRAGAVRVVPTVGASGAGFTLQGLW